MSAISRPVTYVTKVDFAQLDGYGIPADGLGNLGDRYYDIGAGRWYLKRWVGNFAGTDGVLVDASIIGRNVWSFECLVWLDPSTRQFSTIFNNLKPGPSPVGTTNIQYNINDLRVNFFDQGDGAKISSQFSSWLKLKATGNFTSGTNINFNTISINNNTVSNSKSTPTLVDGNCVNFGFPNGGYSFIGKLCEIKINGNGKSTYLTVGEGSGNKTYDRTNSGLDGVITDGSPATFWLQSWVPMDLL